MPCVCSAHRSPGRKSVPIKVSVISFFLRKNKMNIHHVINGIFKKSAGDHCRAGGGNADNRKKSPDGLSLHVADDNPRGLRKPASDARFSINETRYLAGASGLMASAGGCLEAFQKECTVPASAEATLIKTAEITTPGCSL